MSTNRTNPTNRTPGQSRDKTRTATARHNSINRRQSAAAKRTAQSVRFTAAGRAR